MGRKRNNASTNSKSKNGSKKPNNKDVDKHSNSNKKTTKEANGKTINGTASTKASSHAILPSLPSILIFTLSLVAGIFTPPFLSLWGSERASLTTKSNNDRKLPVHSLPAVENKFVGLPPLPSRAICNEETLSKFLHQSPVHGLHIMCFDQIDAATINADGSISNSREEGTRIQLTLYHDAHQADPKPHQITLSKKDFTWDKVKRTLALLELELEPPGSARQPWAMFTTKGEQIVNAIDMVLTNDVSSVKSEQYILESLLSSNTVVLVEGGKWIWPGVKVGFKREVELYSIMPGDRSVRPASAPANNRTVILETLSLTPLVLSVHNYLSDEECDHVQRRSEPKMRYSEVTLKDDDIGKEASQWRTSQNTFLSSDNDDIMRDLEDRTASLTRIQRSHQEHLQVLRYGKTEFYSAHHDFFDPAHYAKDKRTLGMIQNGRRNRMATVFWYLSDVEVGGETVFPKHNGAPQPVDFKDCSRGLKVKPEKGKVIIFYSLDAAGEMDDLSLHGACPVKEGIKWAANKWVWNDEMGFL